MSTRETSAHHPIPRRASLPPPASPQRAGHHAGLHPEDTPETDEMDLTMLDWRDALHQKQRETHQVYVDENDQEYDPDEDERRSLVRKSAIPLRDVPRRSRHVEVSYTRRASRGGERETEQPPAVRPRRRLHWLVFVGLALFIMVLGWVLFTDLAAWVGEQQDTLHYGYPRTAQYDAVVGHADSTAHPSHFLALNLHGVVEVMEFPGGNAAQAKVYVGPTLIGPNADLAVVTLSFLDVNGDGRLDMVINVQGSHFVFLNTGKAFRPVTPTDHINLPNS